MYYTIYKITNLINGKIYIGAHSTLNIDDGYMGSGHALRPAQKKYGIKNFKKEILFVYDTEEEMYRKEAELVTESFCAEKTNYNVRVGGIGGWNHYLGTEQHKESCSKGGRIAAKKTNTWAAEQRANNTPWAQARSAQIAEMNKKKAIDGKSNGWVNYTDDQKKERRKQISQMQQGTGNSQYGRIWISHPITKEVQRISNSDQIPDGWVRGKKGHVPTRIWVNNGKTEHYIYIKKLEDFFENGCAVGRIWSKNQQD